jgi:serine/threonine-protein kinase RsbW
VSELERAGFLPRRIRDTEIAFTEALVNAIRHGNQDDPHKVVRIQYRIDIAGLWLSIEDQGHGFQPDQIADPRLPENLARPGGRGLLLMKSLMNHVEFNSRGNHVVLRLRRHAA